MKKKLEGKIANYFKQAYKKSELPKPLDNYIFKFKKKNSSGQNEYDLPLATIEFKKAIINSDKINEGIFIELTKQFFNKLRPQAIQSFQITHFLSHHYKKLNTQDKIHFIKYIKHVYSKLPDPISMGDTNEKAFLKWVAKFERAPEAAGKQKENLVREKEGEYLVKKGDKYSKKLSQLFNSSNPKYSFESFVSALVKDNLVSKNDGSWATYHGAIKDAGYIANKLMDKKIINPTYGKRLAKAFQNEFRFEIASQFAFEKPFQENNQITPAYFKDLKDKFPNFNSWLRTY